MQLSVYMQLHWIDGAKYCTNRNREQHRAYKISSIIAKAPDAISRSSCSFIITMRIRSMPTSSFPTGLSGVMNHLPEASVCAHVSVNTYHADW